MSHYIKLHTTQSLFYQTAPPISAGPGPTPRSLKEKDHIENEGPTGKGKYMTGRCFCYGTSGACYKMFPYV